MDMKNRESGLISIVTTVIIVFIIAVISLSLSTFSRRELQQSLESQLSAQALYAAESGVNDAISKIQSSIITNAISNCTDSETMFNASNANILDTSTEGSNLVKYTCVLVDLDPPEITADIAQNTIKSYKVDAGSGSNVNQLTFTWRNSGANSLKKADCIVASGCFSTAASWDSTNEGRMGVLRVRLIPKVATMTRATSADTIEVIAYPGGIGASSFTATTTSRQSMLYGSCSGVGSSQTCTVSIGGLSGASNLPGQYYLLLSSYYADSSVTVTGLNSTNNPVSFNGAQATIDSTGAARDVLRRIKVSVPLGNSNSLPASSLTVGSKLCKRFTTNFSATTEVDSATCPSF